MPLPLGGFSGFLVETSIRGKPSNRQQARRIWSSAVRRPIAIPWPPARRLKPGWEWLMRARCFRRDLEMGIWETEDEGKNEQVFGFQFTVYFLLNSGKFLSKPSFGEYVFLVVPSFSSKPKLLSASSGTQNGGTNSSMLAQYFHFWYPRNWLIQLWKRSWLRV